MASTAETPTRSRPMNRNCVPAGRATATDAGVIWSLVTTEASLSRSEQPADGQRGVPVRGETSLRQGRPARSHGGQPGRFACQLVKDPAEGRHALVPGGRSGDAVQVSVG